MESKLWVSVLLSGVAFLHWSLVEYLIHRFAGHGALRSRPTRGRDWLRLTAPVALFYAEHVEHHRDPTYFGSFKGKVVSATVATVTVFFILKFAVETQLAAVYALAYLGAYCAYEVLHLRVHRTPPVGAYGRWVRRHHLSHHFDSPKANFGFSSPIWDLIFRTALPASTPLRVPRALAPRWLLADPEKYARDFTLESPP